MPLSEHEQRLLDEMERNLYGSNADVHAANSAGRPAYRSLVIGIILAIAGIAVLISGVMTQLIILGVAGFAVMFVGVLIAAKPGKATDRASSTRKAQGEARSRPSFMQRMEQRWDGNQENRL